MNKVTVAIAGCGERGQFVYAKNLLKLQDRAQVVAAADTNPDKIESIKRMWKLTDDQCYASTEEMLAQDKLADMMFICTIDQCHYTQAKAALLKGYDLLLEKPLALKAEECLELSELAGKLGRKVVVCHVLRYTVFFQTIKEIIDSGVLGEIATVNHLERVEYWHQAHAFVRGNWRNEHSTTCMILAKCCHDLDIILWLTGKNCKRVSSFGSLMHFNAAHAPEGAPERCTGGCPAEETCPYNAKRFYLGELAKGNVGWPTNMVVLDPTEERLMKALREGPYGRCVYHCDNNVVDHQVVNMEFDDGATACLTMTAFTKKGGRWLNIHGTMGELQADMNTNIIRVMPYVGETKEIDVRKLTDDFSGHAGGDLRMLRELLDLMQYGTMSKSITSIDRSIESHLLALMAEQSRKEGGCPVTIKE